MLRVFITNLGKYNEGALVGQWVDLPATDDELQKVYDEIGINELYEETFISDYETDLQGLTVGEYDSIDELNEIADDLDSLEDYELLGLQAFLENGDSFQDALEHTKNGDFSVWYNCESMEDVAREYIDSTGLLDNNSILSNYFDYEAYGRDMGFEGTFIFIDFDCIELLY